jgi:hypothetical protein
MTVVSLVAVASMQVAVAPTASACADPNCPWSPVTMRAKELCRDVLQELCPF